MGRWLADQAEAQADRWTLWTPVVFGLGAALYFVLPKEPVVWVALACLAVAAGLLIGAAISWTRALTVSLVLSACALGGFGLAKVRTERVWAPIALFGATPQRVEGWVVDVASPGQGGQRLLIAPARIGDWAPNATPVRIRVTLRPGAPVPAPGSPVSLLAIVNAPPPPAAPGAYDFARDAFFESVSGVGFALSPPVTWEPSGEAALAAALADAGERRPLGAVAADRG